MLMLVERRTHVLEQYLVVQGRLAEFIFTRGLFDECLIIRRIPEYLEGFLMDGWDDSTWSEMFVCDDKI